MCAYVHTDTHTSDRADNGISSLKKIYIYIVYKILYLSGIEFHCGLPLQLLKYSIMMARAVLEWLVN